MYLTLLFLYRHESSANLFALLFCRALVAHIGEITCWNSYGRFQLVLMTGSHMAGALAFCTDWFGLGVGTGRTHCRCSLCCKNGGALVVRFLHREPLTTHSATCPFLHHSGCVLPSEFRLAPNAPLACPKQVPPAAT